MTRPQKKNPAGGGVFLASGCASLVGCACEKPLRGNQRNTLPSPRAILFRRFALRRRKTAPVPRNGEPYPGKRAGVRTRGRQSRQRPSSRSRSGATSWSHGSRPSLTRSRRRVEAERKLHERAIRIITPSAPWKAPSETLSTAEGQPPLYSFFSQKRRGK